MNALAQVFPKLFGSPNLPSKHEVDWLNESVRHSPDLWYLEQFEYLLLFSPDETQRGYPQYPLIEDSAFVCHAYTQKNFNYWQERTGDHPIPMEATSDVRSRFFPPPLKIMGELSLIRPYQFRNLDVYKDNRGQMIRKRVKLLVPYRELFEKDYIASDGQELPEALQGKKGVLSPEKVYVIKAWMYVGNPDYWNDILDAGYRSHPFKPVQSHSSHVQWRREYYKYPRREITR